MKRTARIVHPGTELSVSASRAWPSPSGAVLLWLRVAVTRRRLDERLAEGADPAASPALAARARQLTRPRARAAIARSIDDIVRDAVRPPRWSAAVPIARASIRDARAELHRLCEILRGPRPVYARGVALSYLLAREGRSPLYDASDAGPVWYWAQLATRALEGA